MSKKLILFFLLAAFGFAGKVLAQAQPLYGPPIGLAAAKRAAAAAVAAVEKNKLVPYDIAIVDSGGNLVYFERMDGAQLGSIRIAIDKARSAALFRRPTKVWEDFVAKGRTAVLSLPGTIASEGGVPLLSKGKVIGAIGASAGTPEQDGIVAKAGAATVK